VNPLRLVFITPRFWPLVGSAERALANLVAELPARGCRVTVLTAAWEPRWPAQISFRGVPVIRLPHPPRGGWETFRYTRSLARWLRYNRDQYDLVHVSTLKHDAYAAIHTLHRHTSGRRVPVVLRPAAAGRFGDCLWQIDASCGRRIKRECMKAAAFVGPNRAAERELKAAGYPRPKIHYLPDGVPTAPPRNSQAKAIARSALAEANATLEMPAWAPLAVYVGKLHRGRALRHLIVAWEKIVARWPNARLWLAGEGPDRGALSRQLDAMGLAGRAELVGVFDEVAELLAGADLFVMPSLEGGLSLALVEAMTAGLPVVAGNTVANRELITDGQNGLLVSAADADALSGAMARLIDRPDLAVRLGTAARERVIGEFALANMADQYVTLFERLARPDTKSADRLPALQDTS